MFFFSTNGFGQFNITIIIPVYDMTQQVFNFTMAL